MIFAARNVASKVLTEHFKATGSDGWGSGHREAQCRVSIVQPGGGLKEGRQVVTPVVASAAEQEREERAVSRQSQGLAQAGPVDRRGRFIGQRVADIAGRDPVISVIDLLEGKQHQHEIDGARDESGRVGTVHRLRGCSAHWWALPTLLTCKLEHGRARLGGDAKV